MKVVKSAQIKVRASGPDSKRLEHRSDLWMVQSGGRVRGFKSDPRCTCRAEKMEEVVGMKLAAKEGSNH